MAVYAKAIIALASAGLLALQVAMSDSTVTGPEWVSVAIAVVSAAAVYAVPNTSDGRHRAATPDDPGASV